MITPSSLKLHHSLPSTVLDATLKGTRRVMITSLFLLLIGLFPLWLATPVAAQTAACETPYTVRSGDNFGAIAKRCGVTINALKAANPQVTNINLIRVGQRLNIPATGGTKTCGTFMGALDISTLRDQVLSDLGVSIVNPDQFDLKAVPLASYDSPPALLQSWGDLSAAPSGINQHFVAAYGYDTATACWEELSRYVVPGVRLLTDVQATPYPDSDAFELIVGHDIPDGMQYLALLFDGAQVTLLGGVNPMVDTQDEMPTPEQPSDADSCESLLSLTPYTTPENLLGLIRCGQIDAALKDLGNQPLAVSYSDDYSIEDFSVRQSPGVVELNNSGVIQVPFLDENSLFFRIVALNQVDFGGTSHIVFTTNRTGWQYLGTVAELSRHATFEWRIISDWPADHLWLAISSAHTSAGSNWNYERWYDLQRAQFDTPSAEFVTWTGGTRNGGPIGVQTRGYPQLALTEDGTPIVAVKYDIIAKPQDLESDVMLNRQAIYTWDEETQTFIFDAAQSDVTEDQVAVGFSLASDTEFLRFAFAEIKQSMQDGGMTTRGIFRQYLNSIEEDSPEKQELLN